MISIGLCRFVWSLRESVNVENYPFSFGTLFISLVLYPVVNQRLFQFQVYSPAPPKISTIITRKCANIRMLMHLT